MEMERLNAWMTVAGNIAVLLGLVAVAVEINTNTNALHVQIEENSFAMQQERASAVAGNTDLQALYVKSLLNPSEMNPSEVWGAVAILGLQVTSLNRSYLLYKDGMLSEAQWKDLLLGASFQFGGSFGQLYWSEVRDDWAAFPDFVAAIDNELAKSRGKGLSNEEWLRRFFEKVTDLDQ
ncbi:MAG: hypothetical protein OEM64_07920 [Gammaproteobacteria bacterium]|nr:hypothetical protein [Gammaproteobacteria bacterium]